MAPVAMMAPWPGIRRGLEAMVPTVPGLVSEMVVPWKSAGASLPLRARATRSSKLSTILREIQRAGVLDVGHQQVARAVLARDVHGDAQIDLRMHHAGRLRRPSRA